MNTTRNSLLRSSAYFGVQNIFKALSFKTLFLSLLATFFSLCNESFAQGIQLSPEAKASLVTVGPGTELYSGFGHSVLWIYDPLNGLDNAYSYGSFSFETGNFYVKFLRGTLPYTISVAPLAPQVAYWQAENRWVKEQVLNLSNDQKQKLFNFLETNYLPVTRRIPWA